MRHRCGMGAWVSSCFGYIVAAGICDMPAAQAVQHCTAAGELRLLRDHVNVLITRMSSSPHLQDLIALPQAVVKDFLQSLLRNASILKVRFEQQPAQTTCSKR